MLHLQNPSTDITVIPPHSLDVPPLITLEPEPLTVYTGVNMPAAIISSWVIVEDSIIMPTPNLEAFCSMRQLSSIKKKENR